MGYAQLVIGPAGSGKVIAELLLLHVTVMFCIGLTLALYLDLLVWLVSARLFFLQSTYCSSLYQHCETTRRTIHIVNLDPAAENFDYPVAVGE